MRADLDISPWGVHRGVHALGLDGIGGTLDPRNHAGYRVAPWVQMGGAGIEPATSCVSSASSNQAGTHEWPQRFGSHRVACSASPHPTRRGSESDAGQITLTWSDCFRSSASEKIDLGAGSL